ncbi:MAG TPA: M28 family peptidase [Abditibacteriaceae bacterium]|jgi:hypothetical protein
MNRKFLFAGAGFATVVAIAFSSTQLRPAPVAPAASATATTVSANQPAETNSLSAFDGNRAFSLLRAQCDFGPRPLGTPAHEKTAAFLLEQLEPLVDEVKTQKWKQYIKYGPGAGQTFAMTNILALVRGSDDEGKKPEEIRPDLMLSAHWDTRPVADQDLISANRKQPILGANDGASGVAVLLEVTRVLKEKRPRQSIVIALWDGEDLGEFFYGAKYFARTVNEPENKRWRPARGILIDMIGDADLRVTSEKNSMAKAPELWADVHASAAALGLSRHFHGPAMEVLDDHIPLNEAGIPTIDLIDFQYPHWHTVNDTPDKCSPQSLKVIGDVLLHFIGRGAQKA